MFSFVDLDGTLIILGKQLCYSHVSGHFEIDGTDKADCSNIRNLDCLQLTKAIYSRAYN